MIAMTGAQAAWTASQANFGTRSASRIADEIAGAESLSVEKQNPPVGRYLSRRSASIWVLRTCDW